MYRNDLAAHLYECDTCNRFILAQPLDQLEALSDAERSRLVRALRQHYGHGIADLRGGAITELVSGTPDIPVLERRKRLLLRIADLTTDLRDGASISALAKDWADLGLNNPNELAYWLEDLKQQGHEHRSTTDRIRLSPKGLIAADELRSSHGTSVVGFVAMDFGGDQPGRAFSASESRNTYLTGFSIGISDSGYTPLRSGEEDHNEKICDRIMADIRRSRFVVADLSGNNENVFYEAGFARGLGLEVFLTCRTDLFKERFDTRQYNTLLWRDPKDLAVRLNDRICAVIGHRTVASSR